MNLDPVCFSGLREFEGLGVEYKVSVESPSESRLIAVVALRRLALGVAMPLIGIFRFRHCLFAGVFAGVLGTVDPVTVIEPKVFRGRPRGRFGGFVMVIVGLMLPGALEFSRECPWDCCIDRSREGGSIDPSPDLSRGCPIGNIALPIL